MTPEELEAMRVRARDGWPTSEDLTTALAEIDRLVVQIGETKKEWRVVIINYADGSTKPVLLTTEEAAWDLRSDLDLEMGDTSRVEHRNVGPWEECKHDHWELKA